ncbi:MAG: tetratricopeptide repeat protein [Bacteroidia bacterium]|nr:tetratricopeptide repeat protein [Bacteroidia bacterium]
MKNLLNSDIDSIKIKSYLKLTNHYQETSPKQALYYGLKGLQLAKKNNSMVSEIDFLIVLGIISSDNEDFNAALNYHEQALKRSMILKDSVRIGQCYGNIGNIYMYKKNFEKAIDYFTKTLKIFESQKNIHGLTMVYGNLGRLYFYLDKYDEAINFFQQSYDMSIKMNDEQIMATNLMNIGTTYKLKKEWKKGINYLTNAKTIFEKYEDNINIAQCLANIGNCYTGLNEFNKAFFCLRAALEMYDTYQEHNLSALVNNDIAKCLIKQGKYNDAIKYSLKSNSLALKTGDITILEDNYRDLYKVYDTLKDYANSVKYFKSFLIYHDSIYDINISNNIEKLNTEFETERKNQELKLKESQIQKKEVEVQKQRMYIFSLIVVLFLGFLLLYNLLNRYKIKKKANETLTLKNAEILQQKEEITAQRDEIEVQKSEIETQRNEIEKQRNIAVNQRDEIFRQKNDITDSIHYAKRIQTALLPDKLKLQQVLKDGFCYFRPRDIVSGDFYWVSNIQNKSVIIAADCTGHGVPGAFMSIIGMTFLNEIINEKNILLPGEILNTLRENLVKSLQHSSEFDETKDGMDIAILVIDRENNSIEYAGANNPLWVIKKQQEAVAVGSETPELPTTNCQLPTTAANCQLFEFKGDKMPIGISDTQSTPFTNHKIPVNKGDSAYIFSDGFIDQFGGKNNRKFKLNRFKELLLKISDRPMDVQKAILDVTFNQWKGELEQLDDILIIGVKI